MKKIVILCFSICTFSLAGCNKKLTNEQELLNKAREEISIADADTIELRIAGCSTVNNDCLFWFISGNEKQAHTYIPIEFNSVGADEYIYEQTYKPIERSLDIATLMWNKGYSFVVNNSQCSKIQIEKTSGKFVTIPIESIPFVYYYNEMPVSYSFIDVNGDVIP